MNAASGDAQSDGRISDVARDSGTDEGRSLSGRRLGRFRVGPIVSSGPMSALYRAYDVRLDRQVALKVISPLLVRDEEFKARFVDEALSLSAVDHPHVVPLYDHDESPDGHLWLAMRWVDGPTLSDLVANGPLRLERTVRILSQVAEALDAVHARGLVHLDVKPGNILVTPSPRSPNGEHVYLGDFGLTRRCLTPGLTISGDFVGSPAFAAPEHLRGEPVEKAADIYGLACSLYSALTGRPPYTGGVGEVITGHLSGRYRPVSELRAERSYAPETRLDVGAETDRQLGRGLAGRPADRHATASELSRTISRAMVEDGAARDALGALPRPEPPPRPPLPVPRSQTAHASVHVAAHGRRQTRLSSPTTSNVFFTSRYKPPPRPRIALIGLFVALSVVTISVVALFH